MASLVRAREEARSVTPIELFFDLVYVFAISQLSAHLVGDVSLRGMAQTLVLALAGDVRLVHDGLDVELARRRAPARCSSCCSA